MGGEVLGSMIGQAVGTALRNIFNKKATEASIRQAMDPAYFRPVQADLPVERWVHVPGQFAAGIPWGFLDANPDQLRSLQVEANVSWVWAIYDDCNDLRNTTNLLVGPLPYMNFDEFKKMMTVIHEAHIDRAQGLGGRPLGSPRKILVGGSPALMRHYSVEVNGGSRDLDGPVRRVITEVWVPRPQRALWPSSPLWVIQFVGPPEAHRNYFPCFNTVLGTWKWEM
jgi:hypothetical protein